MRDFNTFLKIINKKSICPYCLNRQMSNFVINENIGNEISSLQINVPLSGCVNNCKSCIAKLHNTADKIKIKDNIIIDEEKYLYNLKNVNKKCRNVVLTSDHGEPIQNIKFLIQFGKLNKKLDTPFNIEIQTTGVLLDDKNLNTLKNIGISTISLSIFDIFDNNNNLKIIDVKPNLIFNIINICKNIKEYGFILRLSINLIDVYEKHDIDELFKIINKIEPHQLTFKMLWCTEENNSINKWIENNKCSHNYIYELLQYIKNNGGINTGKNKYIFNNISIYIVDNCMVGNYLILRSDGNLYKSWLDCEPIIF